MYSIIIDLIVLVQLQFPSFPLLSLYYFGTSHTTYGGKSSSRISMEELSTIWFRAIYEV